MDPAQSVFPFLMEAPGLGKTVMQGKAMEDFSAVDSHTGRELVSMAMFHGFKFSSLLVVTMLGCNQLDGILQAHSLTLEQWVKSRTGLGMLP